MTQERWICLIYLLRIIVYVHKPTASNVVLPMLPSLLSDSTLIYIQNVADFCHIHDIVAVDCAVQLTFCECGWYVGGPLLSPI